MRRCRTNYSAPTRRGRRASSASCSGTRRRRFTLPPWRGVTCSSTGPGRNSAAFLLGRPSAASPGKCFRRRRRGASRRPTGASSSPAPRLKSRRSWRPPTACITTTPSSSPCGTPRASSSPWAASPSTSPGAGGRRRRPARRRPAAASCWTSRRTASPWCASWNWPTRTSPFATCWATNGRSNSSASARPTSSPTPARIGS